MKLLGPVHKYVAPITSAVVKLIVPSTHMVELLLAVGKEGRGLTSTFVVPTTLTQPETVVVTLYIPSITPVALAMTGF